MLENKILKDDKAWKQNISRLLKRDVDIDLAIETLEKLSETKDMNIEIDKWINHYFIERSTTFKPKILANRNENIKFRQFYKEITGQPNTGCECAKTYIKFLSILIELKKLL